MTVSAPTLHATAIAVDGRGVLVRGPSGAGKSDLALRCLTLDKSWLTAAPALLIADDQVCLERIGDGVRLSAPAAIRGRLEVRGLGILRWPSLDSAPLALVVDLVARDAVERLPPAGQTTDVLGIQAPRLLVHAFDVSAPLKVILTALDPSRIGTV